VRGLRACETAATHEQFCQEGSAIGVSPLGGARDRVVVTARIGTSEKVGAIDAATLVGPGPCRGLIALRAR
jgi:hypothetical protein